MGKTNLTDRLADMSETQVKNLTKKLLRIRDMPMEYVPHAKQLEFHQSTSRVTLAICGNRAGKSEAAIKEVAWRLCGTHPYKETRVPINAWVCGSDMPHGIMEVLVPKLMQAIPRRMIKKINKTNQGMLSSIDLINGSKAVFKSYDKSQDILKWEGKDIDLVLLDEPPPRDKYIAATRGLMDRGGDIIMSATPLREPWVFDELWQPGLKGDNPRIACYNWSTYDNPHIDHDEVREFEKSLTEEEADIRIYGRFRKLVGRVFKEDPVVIKSFPWTRPYIEGLDPHLSKPHGFLRAGLDEDNNLVVFNAKRPAGTMQELAKHILNTRPSHLPITTLADTSLNTNDQIARVNLQVELEQCGVPTRLAYKRNNVLTGIHQISKVMGAKQLLIMDDSMGLADELKRYQWREDISEKPKGSDDLIDPLRYILIHDPWGMEKDHVIDRVEGLYGSQESDLYGKVRGKAFDVISHDDDKDSENKSGIIKMFR